MECPKPERLSAFLEQESSPAETAAIRQHLLTCQRCVRELELLSIVVTGLQSLPDEPLREDERERLLTLTPTSAPVRRSSPLWRSLLGAAAAVVFAFGLGFVGSDVYERLFPGPELVASASQDFVNEHRGYESFLTTDSDLNVQVSIDQ